jgi:hypothetical protein
MNKPKTIKRAQHDDKNPYFMMRRDTAQDETLSWEARGVLSYLLSKPDDWEINIDDLQQQCGKNRVYRIIGELKKAGYIEDRKKQRASDGTWEWTPYILHETPYPQNHDMETITRKQGNKQSIDNKIKKKEILSAIPSDSDKKSSNETKQAKQLIAIYKTYSKNKDSSMFGWALQDAKSLVKAEISTEDIKLWYEQKSGQDWIKENMNGIPSWRMLVSEIIAWRDTQNKSKDISEIESDVFGYRRIPFGVNPEQILDIGDNHAINSR